MANENETPEVEKPVPVTLEEIRKTAIEMEKEIDGEVILKHLLRNDTEVE
jgi:hypothetical protein